MEVIPHRELRNNSSSVLARVAGGETIAVTNNGRVAAVLVPPQDSELDRVLTAGTARLPRSARPRFDRIRRARSAVSTAEILDDLRRDR
jgi:prevent-host-death family protein